MNDSANNSAPTPESPPQPFSVWDSRNPPPPSSGGSPTGQLVICLIGIGIIALGAYSYWGRTETPKIQVSLFPPVEQKKDEPSTPPANLTTKEPEVPPNTNPPIAQGTGKNSPPQRDPSESLRRAQLALAKTKQREAVNASRRLKSILDDWRNELEIWREQVDSLLTNSDGQFIASNPDSIRAFLAAYESSRPSNSEFTSSADSAKELSAIVENALSDPSDLSSPPPDFINQVESLAASATKGRDAYRASRREIQVLLKLAREKNSRSEIVLKDAIEEFRDHRAQIALQAKKDALQKAQDESDAIDRDIAANKIREAAVTRKRTEDMAAEQRQAEEDMTALRKKARSAEVKRYLGNLFENGFSQPRRTAGMTGLVDRVAKNGPVSLKALESAGCLEPTVEGLRQLNLAMTGLTDRTKWQFSFNPVDWSPDNQKFIKQAQDYLVELGPALVKEGLLAE